MNERKRLLGRARWVEIGSLLYNAVEIVISLAAGFLSGSSALISWGLDSIVEAASAATLIWRLHGEEADIGRRRVLRRKKVALGVISAAFWIVVAFILYEAGTKLLAQKAPGFSTLGIGILLLSLAVNPLLAWGKYHYGKALNSSELKYDATDTLICQYQTVVVLIGLVLTHTMGWWWADPAAALAILPYVAWQGLKAGREAWKIDPQMCHQRRYT